MLLGQHMEIFSDEVDANRDFAQLQHYYYFFFLKKDEEKNSFNMHSLLQKASYIFYATEQTDFVAKKINWSSFWLFPPARSAHFNELHRQYL